MNIRALLSLIILWLGSPSWASAQAPEMSPVAPVAVPAPAATAAKIDEVALQNGGFLRGTISEYVPGDHLVLITLTGEVQRIAASEIASITPGAQPPAPAPEPAPTPAATPATPAMGDTLPLLQVHAKEARFHFEGLMPDLTLHARLVGSSYVRVCSAPCEASLPEGSYEFGISRADLDVRSVRGLTVLKGGETLQGDMPSRRPGRVVLAVVGGALAITGIALMATAPPKAGIDDPDFMKTRPQMVAGGVLTAVAALGTVLGEIVLRDRPTLTVKN